MSSSLGKSLLASLLLTLSGSLIAAVAHPDIRLEAQSSGDAPAASKVPDAASPADWLRKMGQALRQTNYDGIFTYMRGSTFDTVRIVHVSDNGQETERLFNLNGEVRELYRHDDEVMCYHPVDAVRLGESISDHSVQIGPFSPAFSERVLSTRNLYNLSLHGTARIAGRSAVKLAISPRNNDRYGYRIWLDEATGLLLQSHLIDRGKVKEIFQFTSLEVGSGVSMADLETAIPGETLSHALALESNDGSEQPVFRVKWLPDGFRPVRSQGNRLHFSDGLANFSVFVDKPGAPTLPEMTTTVGGTVVITRRMKSTGPQITVVGEVPIQTAKKVAESVETVVY